MHDCLSQGNGWKMSSHRRRLWVSKGVIHSSRICRFTQPRKDSARIFLTNNELVIAYERGQVCPCAHGYVRSNKIGRDA
jgi:hypothetical protein